MPKIKNWDKKGETEWWNRDLENNKITKITVKKSYSNLENRGVWRVEKEGISDEWGESFSGRGMTLEKFETKEEAMKYAVNWMKNHPDAGYLGDYEDKQKQKLDKEV